MKHRFSKCSNLPRFALMIAALAVAACDAQPSGEAQNSPQPVSAKMAAGEFDKYCQNRLDPIAAGYEQRSASVVDGAFAPTFFNPEYNLSVKPNNGEVCTMVFGSADAPKAVHDAFVANTDAGFRGLEARGRDPMTGQPMYIAAYTASGRAPS